ncbi:hypothetical protein Acy02nite_06170 [Actinoplanes cyaneus]|uniref:Uncharacterized protein n=1 Tax=Actinoplanes cyaneus TaxID=52696 RepID=A0A919M977_9ACTN|nr:hypothetical protein [Actinoplanes cyaneus]MCW2135899.1 hypothetical protein [Actinoplanes cyaneus]GID62736.1 hypothetical protein Acy02nite_06170 [Actinoplanes cyaneus]
MPGLTVARHFLPGLARSLIRSAATAIPARCERTTNQEDLAALGEHGRQEGHVDAGQ